MVLPKLRAPVQPLELLRARAVEVVVVHPHGDVDAHPQLVPSVDHRLKWILAPLEHAPHVLGVTLRPYRRVHAPLSVAEPLVHLRGPLGLVGADAPEHGVDLRTLQRPVDLLHEPVGRLRVLVVVQRRAVPVEDDPVVRGRLSHPSSLTCPLISSSYLSTPKTSLRLIQR